MQIVGMNANHRRIARMFGRGLSHQDFWKHGKPVAITYSTKFLVLIEKERIKALEKTTAETLRNMTLEGFLGRNGEIPMTMTVDCSDELLENLENERGVRGARSKRAVLIAIAQEYFKRQAQVKREDKAAGLIDETEAESA